MVVTENSVPKYDCTGEQGWRQEFPDREAGLECPLKYQSILFINPWIFNIVVLTEQCRKILEGFLVGYRAEKCHFLDKFGRILGLKRSLAVCTTVVQLGILRLSKRNSIKRV